MLDRAPRLLAGLLALALASIPLLAPRSLAAQAPDSVLLDALEWRSIGPTNMSGRITDVEGVPGTSTFYVAAAAGGIWKTINNGTTFTPVFDDQRVISMGDIAVAPSDPTVIYAGTGEEDSRNSISPGGGVYVSRDGGESWTLAGLEATEVIGRIVVHPADPNTAWVAALGHIWDHNPERGVYKTTDGGESWRQVHSVSDRAGFVDLVLDPRNPDVLWSASWERVRGPWFLESGGPGSGLWKSTDGGERWSEVEGGGFPSTTLGRIGLAIAPSDPDILYALVEAEEGEGLADLDDEAVATSGLKGSGLYRSEDGGATWRWMNGENTRPFYYSQVRVAPDDPDLVFWSSTPVQFSKDGGETVGEATIGIHVDHHAMWWDPLNPDHFIVGNDGGIAVTWDRGGTYDFINTLPLGQFYHVSYNMEVPYRVCGGLQDNGTWCGPSRRARGDIDHHMWFTISGGDGFYSQQDPTDPAIVYAESQGGSMARLNLETGERSALEVPDWKERVADIRDSVAVYEGVEEPRELTPAEAAKVSEWKAEVAADSATYDLRFNWSTPLIMSPHDPHTIYAAGNRVMMSADQGRSFEVVSPDLTTADTMKIRVSTRETGGITRDVTGAETHATIVTLAESPLVEGRLFAGTDDGNVWLRPGPDADWQQFPHRAFPGLPANTWVSRVEPSHHDPDRLYVSFDGHRTNDFTPYIYVTDDLQRFRRITGGLPTGAPDFVHVIREDPVDPDLLFAGTDVGAYVSLEGGRSWQPLMNGLPTVPVHDLKIHPRDAELIAATHGRSVWILDIAPLQQRSRIQGADGPVLLDPVPGLQYGDAPSGGESTGHRYFAGESRPYGAEIVYWVPASWEAPETGAGDDAAADAASGPARRGGRGDGPKAEIAVLGEHGDTVATLEGPLRPGLHRVRWNLRSRSEEEEEVRSPAELRDSLQADRLMAELADSLVAFEGVSRAAVQRGLAMARSGNLAAMFGGGRGAASGDPDRPGERYPDVKPAWVAEAEAAEEAEEEAEAEEAEPTMDEVRSALMGMYYAMRARGVSMSFRGGFGRGGDPVAPGEYTVTVTMGDGTQTTTLTVLRADGYEPEPREERTSVERWLAGEGPG